MTEAERKLIRFAARVMDLHRNDGYPGDVDGGALQDAAEACGLLVPVPVTEPCVDSEVGLCACADCDNIPGNCYRLEAQVQLAMAEAEADSHSQYSSSK